MTTKVIERLTSFSELGDGNGEATQFRAHSEPILAIQASERNDLILVNTVSGITKRVKGHAILGACDDFINDACHLPTSSAYMYHHLLT